MNLIGKLFSCCSQSYFFLEDSDTSVKEQPANTFLHHQCSKVTIWQEKKGLKRFYKRT